MIRWLTFLILAGSFSLTVYAQQPNFVVIIADDLAWNDVGAYGHPTIRTPNIDRLAAEGMQFDLAFLTTSSCSPSRSSILTGRYPHNTGAGELHLPLPADQVLFPGLLRQAGYYTAAAGKWHLGESVIAQLDTVYARTGPSGAERWIDALRERPPDQPFFFWLAAVDPHRGYEADILDQPHRAEEVVLPPFIPDTPEVRADFALYYDEVARLDRYVGDVMAELKRQGVDQNTVVLFLSDNGRPFPRCKTTLYDCGVKTPFIVRWPEHVKAGSHSRSLVSSIDLAPTLLDLAGRPPSPAFQGVSFAPVLSEPTLSVRDYVYAEHNWHDYQARERSVRSSRYLYIRNDLPELPGTPPADAVNSPTFAAMRALMQSGGLLPHQMGCFTVPRPRDELYDTVMDPHQLRNLAEEPAYAGVLQAFREIQQQWAEDTADTMPSVLTPDGFDRVTGAKIISTLHPNLRE